MTGTTTINTEDFIRMIKNQERAERRIKELVEERNKLSSYVCELNYSTLLRGYHESEKERMNQCGISDEEMEDFIELVNEN